MPFLWKIEKVIKILKDIKSKSYPIWVSLYIILCLFLKLHYDSWVFLYIILCLFLNLVSWYVVKEQIINPFEGPNLANAKSDWFAFHYLSRRIFEYSKSHKSGGEGKYWIQIFCSTFPTPLYTPPIKTCHVLT